MWAISTKFCGILGISGIKEKSLSLDISESSGPFSAKIGAINGGNFHEILRDSGDFWDKRKSLSLDISESSGPFGPEFWTEIREVTLGLIYRSGLSRETGL